MGVPPVCVCAILRKRKTPAHRDQRCPGQKESLHMSNSTIGPPGQAGSYANNPYLVSALHSFLGDQGWSFERLALMMSWNQESRAEISEVALGLGLITQASLAVEVKAIKARPLPPPQTADILILPVPLRPRPEPVSIKPEPSSEWREPAPWTTEGQLEAQPEGQPERTPTQPAPWTVTGGDDDGQ